MNELSIALGALGVLVLGGVLAHGAWQARRAGPKRAADAVEPVLDDAAPSPAGESAQAESATAEARLAAATARRQQPRLDALVDALATIAIEAPVAGTVLVAHLPTTRRAGSKPFWIEGLEVSGGEWEMPLPEGQYRELQAGVQLANRKGPLNEIEYSEFVQKVQSFAESIGALVDFPDMIDVVARARELDHFASQHDAQLAVQLQAMGAAWSVGYIEQHALSCGFKPGTLPGRMVLPSPEVGLPPLATLHFDPQAALADDPNVSSVRTVTLSFDVPQTPAAAEPFDAWQASARALAASMEAAIVDDRGRPLGDESFAAIGRELQQLYRALEARDLAAGSAAARRLFS